MPAGADPQPGAARQRYSSLSRPQLAGRVGVAALQKVKNCAPAMAKKSTEAVRIVPHLPGGMGPSVWLRMHEWSPHASIAQILIQPVGLPIAASGIAHSIPVPPPAPGAASQPAVTPA